MADGTPTTREAKLQRPDHEGGRVVLDLSSVPDLVSIEFDAPNGEIVLHCDGFGGRLKIRTAASERTIADLSRALETLRRNWGQR